MSESQNASEMFVLVGCYLCGEAIEVAIAPDETMRIVTQTCDHSDADDPGWWEGVKEYARNEADECPV